MAYESAPKRGVAVHYGPRDLETARGGDLGSKNRVKEVVIPLGITEMNATSFSHSEFAGLHAPIPAGALIVDASLHVTTLFNGTTPTAAVGLRTSANVSDDIDDDGLIASVSVATVGEKVGSGALIDTVLAADGYLYLVGSATNNTAGAAELVIKYVI